MIVFSFPPQAARETEPYWLSGRNFGEKTASGELLVVPPGAAAPRQAAAPVFCMDCSAPGATILPEPQNVPEADVWVSSRLSGGTLHERLTQAVAAYGRRLWLRIEPLCTRFPMPCFTGEGTEAAEEERREIQTRYPVFYSPELLCNYCVLTEEGQASMFLFDTPQTIAKKLTLAQEIGVGFVFGEIPTEAIQ